MGSCHDAIVGVGDPREGLERLSIQQDRVLGTTAVSLSRSLSLSLASDRDTTHVRSACNLTLVLSRHCLVARFVRASSVPLLANDFR